MPFYPKLVTPAKVAMRNVYGPRCAHLAHQQLPLLAPEKIEWYCLLVCKFIVWWDNFETSYFQFILENIWPCWLPTIPHTTWWKIWLSREKCFLIANHSHSTGLATVTSALTSYHESSLSYGDHAVHYRMLGNIPGFSSLDASNTRPSPPNPFMTTNDVSRHYPMSTGG